MRVALEKAYVARLRRRLAAAPRPRHVGLIMDGNRRWARIAGHRDPSVGHRYGADHLATVLGWCADAGVECVSAYLLSRDNLDSRDAAEVDALLGTIEAVLPRALEDDAVPWEVRLHGHVDLLPASTAAVLKETVDRTKGRPRTLNLALAYDAHQDIADAFRRLVGRRVAAGDDLRRVAETITVDELARSFTTSTSPDIDFVIRTSGEQRVSGFLPWQSSHADIYVCEAYWPAFREVDLFRALREYARRH